MIKLLKHMKGYRAAAISAPFFKVLEALFELMIPLVVAEIIDTIAYKTFLKSGEWELSAAMGMFKMGINFILMIIGNIVTKKITGYSMYAFDN